MPILPCGWASPRTKLKRRFSVAIDRPRFGSLPVKSDYLRVHTIVAAADGSGDYEKIQDALDALPSGGGEVFVKDGSFIPSSPPIVMPENSTLRGVGYGSYIQLKDNSDCNLIENSGAADEHLSLRDLRLDGNSSNNSTGNIINLDSVTHPDLHFLELTNAPVNAIRITDSRDSAISNCKMNTSATDSLIYLDNADYTHLIGCFITSAKKYGIYLTDCFAGKISSSTITLSEEDGLFINSCENVKIVNCEITSSNEHGIQLDTSVKTTINACDIVSSSAGASNTYDGIRLAGTSTRNRIVANSLRDLPGAPKMRYGISEASAADDYNSIGWNSMEGFVSGAFSLLGPHDQISDNVYD